MLDKIRLIVLGLNCTKERRGLGQSLSSLAFELKTLFRLLHALPLTRVTDSAVPPRYDAKACQSLRSFLPIRNTWLRVPGHVRELPLIDTCQDVWRMFLTAPQMRQGAGDVVLRRNFPCGRTDFGWVECGWHSPTCDSGGLDLVLERDCLGDDPRAGRTYQPGVLTDQVRYEGPPMKGSYGNSRASLKTIRKRSLRRSR
jgi:hypothetical protein